MLERGRGGERAWVRERGNKGRTYRTLEGD